LTLKTKKDNQLTLKINKRQSIDLENKTKDNQLTLKTKQKTLN